MPTTNYDWALPTIGGSEDIWGDDINATLEAIDGALFGVAGRVDALEGLSSSYLEKTGGALTGALTGTTATFSGAVQGLSGTFSTLSGALTGNASTASRLATGRTIGLTGAVSGSGVFDGSGNLTITTALVSSISIDKVSGLQGALDGKLAKTGGTMTANIVRDGSGPHFYHASPDFGSARVFVSDTGPVGGSDGDIWLEY